MKRVVILVLVIAAALTTVISFATARLAEADTEHHNESTDGDLSDDPLDPKFVLAPGVNTWTGAIEPTAPSQQDRWAATLPANHVITAISYTRAGASGDAAFGFLNPSSGFEVSPTDDVSASVTFTPALSATGDYMLEIITDFLESEKAWTVEITVEAVVPTDTTPPVASPVSISSDNANPARAKVGDIVTVDFTTDEDIAAPTVTIGGASASVIGGPTVWSASREMAAGDTEGAVSLTIDATDLAGNVAAQVTAATDGSIVTFDKTAPTISPVTIASNNADDAFAKVGDTVTISFGTSESVQTPTVAVGGSNATVSGGPTSWTASRVMESGDAEGIIAFSITADDLAGNAASPATATTDSSSVTFDKTAPVITSASISSNNANPELAKAGDTVSVAFITNEAVRTPTVTIGGTSAVVTGGPTNWNASRVMAAGESEGIVTLAINALDLAGNAAAQVTATTDGSAVTFDDTSPGFTSVSIGSNNANPAFAKVGDTVTLAFTSNEPVNTPSVTIGGSNAPVTGGPTIWSASRTMAAGDVEGIVPFTIDATGLAGEPATQVTTTTDGSSVTFDKTSPQITSVGISSNNANPSLANVGDRVTLDFRTNEDARTPTVSIGGAAAAVAGGPREWSAGRLMTAGDTEGVVAFSINAADRAGNAASPATATTNGSAVTFDKTAPEIISVKIASDNANPSLAKVGDRVTLDFETSESVQTPAVVIGGSNAAVTGGPRVWRASRQMRSTDAEGIVTFTIDAASLSGETLPQANSTTNGSSVRFDKTPPETAIVSATVDVGSSVSNGANTNSTSLRLSFEGMDNVGIGGFKCWLDGGAGANCASPAVFNNLSHGSHTVKVAARDTAGNVDPTPASFSWNINGDVGGGHDIDNICDLIESLDIHHGIKRSLLAKLKWFDCRINDHDDDDDDDEDDDEDDEDRDRDKKDKDKKNNGKAKGKDKHAFNNSFKALINQVNALRGKKISIIDSNIIINQINLIFLGKDA